MLKKDVYILEHMVPEDPSEEEVKRLLEEVRWSWPHDYRDTWLDELIFKRTIPPPADRCGSIYDPR